MDYSPQPTVLTDNQWECVGCGEIIIAHYVSQLKCPECGGTTFQAPS